MHHRFAHCERPSHKRGCDSVVREPRDGRGNIRCLGRRGFARTKAARNRARERTVCTGGAHFAIQAVDKTRAFLDSRASPVVTT